MTNTNKSLNYATIAEEIHKITHEVRGALSVLQVGAQLFERSRADGAENALTMQSKITQVNNYCDRLDDISKALKKQV
jgi:nitrogen-specific signal transduction histidine kinase